MIGSDEDSIDPWHEVVMEVAVLGGALYAASRCFHPCLPAGRLTHREALSHRFGRLGRHAGIDQTALHRLRHGVATHVVKEGQLLKAQVRLGHRDPSMTLRHYSHGTSLDE
jgi:integrase